MAIIHLPPSKSIGARYFVASYFAGTLKDTPVMDDCDDLKVIRKALISLNDAAKHPEMGMATLDVHASGTAFRFMMATAASTPYAKVMLSGTPRLCSRPMKPLIEVLRKAGADIRALGDNETGPYEIRGKALTGGDYEIRGDVSSQFISALMLAAPTFKEGVKLRKGGMKLRFTTPLVSRPYAEMTAKVMTDFGIDVMFSQEGVSVAQGTYITPKSYRVEADWSAAGFMFEAALLGRSVLVADLASPSESMQGDAATASVFARLGVESQYDLKAEATNETYARIWQAKPLPERLEADMTDTPDLVPALMTGCAFSAIPFRLTGVRNLRLKESDRLEAMRRELGKFGYIINIEEDAIGWKSDKKDPEEDIVVDTYDDHRIAMAFGVAPLKTGRVKIAHPEVVEKSFADFWNQLSLIGLSCRREGDMMIVEHEKDN